MNDRVEIFRQTLVLGQHHEADKDFVILRLTQALGDTLWTSFYRIQLYKLFMLLSEFIVCPGEVRSYE